MKIFLDVSVLKDIPAEQLPKIVEAISPELFAPVTFRVENCGVWLQGPAQRVSRAAYTLGLSIGMEYMIRFNRENR